MGLGGKGTQTLRTGFDEEDPSGRNGWRGLARPSSRRQGLVCLAGRGRGQDDGILCRGAGAQLAADIAPNAPRIELRPVERLPSGRLQGVVGDLPKVDGVQQDPAEAFFRLIGVQGAQAFRADGEENGIAGLGTPIRKAETSAQFPEVGPDPVVLTRDREQDAGEQVGLADELGDKGAGGAAVEFLRRSDLGEAPGLEPGGRMRDCGAPCPS